MVKINVGGCSSFVKDAEYQKYVEKALAAYDVLEAESGAGNDFLGWKTLPVDTSAAATSVPVAPSRRSPTVSCARQAFPRSLSPATIFPKTTSLS